MGPDAAEYPGGGVAGPATAALGVVAAGVASGPAPRPIICCTVEGPAPRGPTVPGIIFIPGSIGTWPAVPGIIVAPGPLGPALDSICSKADWLLSRGATAPAPMPIICSKADWLLSREATACAAAVAVGPGGSSDALAEDTGLSALSICAGDGTPLAANSDGVARPPGLYGLA